eukprot:COSAG02_NODE_4342_length_5477_cov_3.682968_8_plen_124_part_00
MPTVLLVAVLRGLVREEGVATERFSRLPPVTPHRRRRRCGWSGSLVGLGRVLQLGVAERPSLRSRGRTLCPTPAPSEGGAAARSEELLWRCLRRPRPKKLWENLYIYYNIASSGVTERIPDTN